MKRTLKFLFLTIEINLLLWLALMGGAHASGSMPGGADWWECKVPANRMLLFVGVGFAVIVQHWAYYAVYLRAKKFESALDTTPS